MQVLRGSQFGRRLTLATGLAPPWRQFPGIGTCQFTLPRFAQARPFRI